MIYRARKPQLSYGRPVGIISLEENIPCPPGTPGNPTTFAFPVRYEVARGVSPQDLADPARPGGVQAVLAAGRSLVEKGACAVAGNCGLLVVHQRQLAQALAVPVLLSSLLQLPLLAQMFGARAAIGVIASSASRLTPGHLHVAAAGAEIRIALASMEGKPHFQAAVAEERGELDFHKVEMEVVDVVQALVAREPDVRAILFECVDLPPYAAAVQRAVGLPVFDAVTLINHAYSGLVRRDFIGVY
jgi:hypothetical protein